MNALNPRPIPNRRRVNLTTASSPSKHQIRAWRFIWSVKVKSIFDLADEQVLEFEELVVDGFDDELNGRGGIELRRCLLRMCAMRRRQPGRHWWKLKQLILGLQFPLVKITGVELISFTWQNYNAVTRPMCRHLNPTLSSICTSPKLWHFFHCLRKCRLPWYNAWSASLNLMIPIYYWHLLLVI